MRALLWREVPEPDRWQKDVCIARGVYARPGEPAFFIEWEKEGPGPWICDACVFEGRRVEGQEVVVSELDIQWMKRWHEEQRREHARRGAAGEFDDLPL